MANMFQVEDNYRNVNVTLTQTRKQEKKNYYLITGIKIDVCVL